MGTAEELILVVEMCRGKWYRMVQDRAGNRFKKRKDNKIGIILGVVRDVVGYLVGPFNQEPRSGAG